MWSYDTSLEYNLAHFQFLWSIGFLGPHPFFPLLSFFLSPDSSLPPSILSSISHFSTVFLLSLTWHLLVAQTRDLEVAIISLSFLKHFSKTHFVPKACWLDLRLSLYRHLSLIVDSFLDLFLHKRGEQFITHVLNHRPRLGQQCEE